MNQFVSVSLLTIIASSFLTDTLAAQVVDQDIIRNVCQQPYHGLKPANDLTKTAIENAKLRTTKFFQRELQTEYAAAIAYIHTLKNDKWNVIEDIPKEPNKPTPPNVLNNINEQDSLSHIYKDLHLILHAIEARDSEAAGIIGSREDVIMLDAFKKDTSLVINTIIELLHQFNVKKLPKIPKAKPLPSSAEKEEYDFRIWVLIYDYVILLEYTNDVIKHLLKKYCGIDA